MDCVSTYISALTYYDALQFHYICLGDSVELWENNLFAVKTANKLTVEKEKLFIQSNGLQKYLVTIIFSGTRIRMLAEVEILKEYAEEISNKYAKINIGLNIQNFNSGIITLKDFTTRQTSILV